MAVTGGDMRNRDVVWHDGICSGRMVGTERKIVTTQPRGELSREEIECCLNCTKEDCTGNCAEHRAVARQYGKKRKKKHD